MNGLTKLKILAIAIAILLTTACDIEPYQAPEPTPEPTPEQTSTMIPLPLRAPEPTSTMIPLPPSLERGVPCTVEEYKSKAIPQMKRLQSQMVGLDFSANGALRKRHVETLLSDIQEMDCADSFPFKQETLEYTAIHFINAIDHALAGDLFEMQLSITAMNLNVEAFWDWSKDMSR